MYKFSSLFLLPGFYLPHIQLIECLPDDNFTHSTVIQLLQIVFFGHQSLLDLNSKE